jgi:hypothetical protein
MIVEFRFATEDSGHHLLLWSCLPDAISLAMFVVHMDHRTIVRSLRIKTQLHRQTLQHKRQNCGTRLPPAVTQHRAFFPLSSSSLSYLGKPPCPHMSPRLAEQEAVWPSRPCIEQMTVRSHAGKKSKRGETIVSSPSHHGSDMGETRLWL